MHKYNDLKVSDSNTKQIILEAAEAEFLEKGYGTTKMMTIAKRAGVSHSMLHYYFASKENLFQTIFVQKSQTLLPLLEGIIEQHLPFSETLRNLIETQFDFLARNPKLPYFLLSEILTNKENRALLLSVISSKLSGVYRKMRKAFDEAIENGTIRPIAFHNLIMNAISLNVTSFVILPIVQDFLDDDIEKLLKERCESNVQFVLAALRP